MQEPRITRVCSVVGCERRHWAKGLCTAHYQQHKKGKPLTPLGTPMPEVLPSESGEEWRAVADWNGWYEVSSYGRIRSRGRMVMAGSAKIWKPCRIIRGSLDRKGYRIVVLRDGDRFESRYHHRLVLFAFVGPCPEGMEACHNDGNKLNNKLDNLRWDTPQANAADKERHGTAHRGETVNGAKLREADIPRIRALLAQGKKQTEVAAEYSVSHITIHDIAAGKTWSHVPLHPFGQKDHLDEVATIARLPDTDDLETSAPADEQLQLFRMV